MELVKGNGYSTVNVLNATELYIFKKLMVNLWYVTFTSI